MPSPSAESPRKLIIYACPTGPLAEQISAFYGASHERFGRNSAHAYPAHITLTGFFHDDATTIPRYIAALETAHARAMASRPPFPVQIREVAFLDTFHGLFIESPWLEMLTADVAATVDSPTRRDTLRVKSDLHLSLAYDFRPGDGPALADMAASMLDISASVAWNLCLYEQLPDGGWVCHARWELG